MSTFRTAHVMLQRAGYVCCMLPLLVLLLLLSLLLLFLLLSRLAQSMSAPKRSLAVHSCLITSVAVIFTTKLITCKAALSADLRD
jgi:hypothetical protein